MKLKHQAIAGTLESSDIQIIISPHKEGRKIILDSTVYSQFGKQIKETILDVLDNLEVENVKLIAKDQGALDCTIRSRIQTAIFRANDIKNDLPWGGKI